MHDRAFAERAQQRELHRLRQQRQAEVEVEDVRRPREVREGSQLRRLLAGEPTRPLEVDVGFRVQPVAVEDDELRFDAACAQRLDVRPRDPCGVDGAVGDAHGVTLARAGTEPRCRRAGSADR